MDPIDKQSAIEIVDRYNKSHMILTGKPMLGAASIMIELEDLPTIEERKTGRWVGNPETCEFMTCSACGCEFDWVSEGGYPSNEWAYCPECGAWMGGDTE